MVARRAACGSPFAAAAQIPFRALPASFIASDRSLRSFSHFPGGSRSLTCLRSAVIRLPSAAKLAWIWRSDLPEAPVTAEPTSRPSTTMRALSGRKSFVKVFDLSSPQPDTSSTAARVRHTNWTRRAKRRDRLRDLLAFLLQPVQEASLHEDLALLRGE